jgi:HemY protein
VRGLFWLVALFGIAVAVAVGARYNEGYVLLVFPPWRAEVSLNLFIVALLALVIALFVALRAVAFTIGLPGRARAWRERRRREAGIQLFRDSLRLLFEGRFSRALKKAEESFAAGIVPGLSALIAARAAQRLRETEGQQQWLERARNDERNEAAALMLEAEMLNDARRFEEALGVLGQLQEKKGRHIAALRLELRARQGTGDWDGVLRIARQLDKRTALPAEVAREIKAQAHLENIGRMRGDVGQLRDYLRRVPSAEQGRRLTLAAARSLAGLGAVDDVQRLIETALESEDEAAWQPELVDLYGNLAGPGATARIARAEKWLPDHADDAGLLLALGRMCLRQQLWGKAQSYLEASLAVAETREAHLELAMLCDQLERTDEANRHYRAGARLAGR